MYDICTIGHITLDKVVTTKSVKHMPGGTSFYFSKAIQQFDINYVLVTALAESEMNVVEGLRKDGIGVHTLPSDHSVYFENIYSENQDYREQNVLQKAAPFGISVMPAVDAKIYHLGPLLSDDISVDLIRFLSLKGLVSLDVQGLLRSVVDKKVIYHDWADKTEALPYVSILKANEHEMEVVTGWSDVQQGARYLADLGVQEVIITLGSRGSLIFKDGIFHEIPAYKPSAVIDATGCGDTYMAGYLTKKVQGGNIQESGEYGAAMATLKIGSSGPFSGDSATVEEILKNGVAEKYNVLQVGL